MSILGAYLQTKWKQKCHLKFWDPTVLQKSSNLMLFLNSIKNCNEKKKKKNCNELYQDNTRDSINSLDEK